MITEERTPVLIVTSGSNDGEAQRLTGYLEQRGYAVRVTGDLDQGALIASRSPIRAMVIDVSESEMKVVAAIGTMLATNPAMAVVALTAPDAARVAVWCLEAGATRCLVKPVEPTVLELGIRSAMMARVEQLNGDRRVRWLRETLSESVAALTEERSKLVRWSVAALEALTAALEAKDEYMAGHSLRVAHVAGTIAAELGRTDEEIESVRLAGRLHDIGMIGVPSRLLAKAGPLTAEEMTSVKEHVVVGRRILEPFESLREIVSFIRGHHERWDGTGYPDRLAGGAIPWGGRVLAVAETFDAVTSPRPFRGEMTRPAAMELMAGLAGRALDPLVFQALRTVVTKRLVLAFLSDRDGFVPEDPATLQVLIDDERRVIGGG
jgi:putative nucleotidyltransferase with HDIG domain